MYLELILKIDPNLCLETELWFSEESLLSCLLWYLDLAPLQLLSRKATVTEKGGSSTIGLALVSSLIQS